MDHYLRALLAQNNDQGYKQAIYYMSSVWVGNLKISQNFLESIKDYNNSQKTPITRERRFSSSNLPFV